MGDNITNYPKFVEMKKMLQVKNASSLEWKAMVEVKTITVDVNVIDVNVVDVLPSPLLDPSWVQRNHTSELFGTWGTLPTSSTKRGRGAC
jgi:hypothetical protein